MRQRHPGYRRVEIAVTCIETAPTCRRAMTSFCLLVRRLTLADVARRFNWTFAQPTACRDATDCIQYRLGGDRLFQVSGGRRLLDARMGRRVVVRRNENDRHREPLLELETVHPVHVNIEDEAVRATDCEPLEKLARGRERHGLVAGRRHDAK